MKREETELLGRLPSWRYEKSVRIKSPEERMRSIAAGLLLVKAGFGKDLVEADSKTGSKKYNLSHSGNYVAMVVGENAGIDIETKEDKNFKITKRMFCESEQEYILDGEESKAQMRFRNIWTAKESFLKCTREGISVPLNSFTLDMETGQVVECEKEVDSEKKGYDFQGKTYYTVTVTEDEYSMSVTALTDKIFTLDIEYVKVLV